VAERRAPTISDVARRAGVGTGTVSRVLNGSPRVSPATHARVREAIEHLGYRRNAAARSLSLGRSQSVGVVAPFFTTPSVVERLRGVSARLAAHGYDLVLFAVETPAQRRAVFREFARRDRVTGLLVISLPLTDEEVGTLRAERLPAVLVDVGHPGLPSVGTDDVRGGELAGEHLIGLGHERIGFVGDAAENPFGFTSSEHRRAGLRRALARAGLPAGEGWERVGIHGRAPAREMAADLLARADRPSAVFAASDIQALGVLEAARDAGLRVPEDLAVIGFDDVELAGLLGLSTVRQPLARTGELGAALLVAVLEDSAAPDEALPALEVVRRRTT
jgi:DNA-binding LacI/PurR family transcriptional regulator